MPARPRIWGAVRAAASDFFYHSWRLVPANALVAAAILAVIATWLGPGFGVALLVTPLVAFPVAGLARLAGFITRSRDAVLSDVWSGWRATWREILGLGVVLTLACLVFATNIALGFATGPGPAMFIAVLAGWGLVFTWVYALVAWPILMDPARTGTRVRDRLRLAGLLVIAFPLRMLAFGIVTAAFLAVSTVLFAAVLTVSFAFAALVAGRYVLPAADRLSARSGVAPSSVASD